MELSTATQETLGISRPLTRAAAKEPRWGLAFLGILGYLVVEYTRLPAMFPVLIPLELGKVVILASLLGWVLSPRLRTVVSREVRRIDVMVLLFSLAAILSCLFAEFQDQAWGFLVGLLGFVLVYFLIGRVVTNEWRLRVFIGMFLVLNFKLAQFVVRSYDTLRHAGVSSTRLAYGIGAGSTGFFSNSNDFGAAMCVAWPIASLLLFSDIRKHYKLVLALFSGAFLLAILLCSSRGTLLGAAAVVLVFFLRRKGRGGALLMLVALLAGVWFVMPERHKERARMALDYGSDPSAVSRFIFWKAGVRMFMEHPVLGVGPGNFPKAYKKYEEDRTWRGERACHSVYVQSISELGITGTLPFVFLSFFLLGSNAKTRRDILVASPQGERSFGYCLALGLDLALVGFLVSGAFLSMLYYPHLYVLLGLSAGLRTASAGISSQNVEHPFARQKGDLLPAVLLER